jgi:hypothetical protein
MDGCPERGEPAVVLSHPFARKKAKGWGTEPYRPLPTKMPCPALSISFYRQGGKPRKTIYRSPPRTAAANASHTFRFPAYSFSMRSG